MNLSLPPGKRGDRRFGRATVDGERWLNDEEGRMRFIQRSRFIDLCVPFGHLDTVLTWPLLRALVCIVSKKMCKN